VRDLGACLYETVQEYAAVGAHHRTGTAEDARTLDWFEDRVRADALAEQLRTVARVVARSA
jgi:hypothetical protein